MLDRYTLPPMKELWVRKETKFEFWLRVELAYLLARLKLVQLSEDTYDTIKGHAKINVNRIEELDREYRHDLIAFIVAVQESLAQAGVSSEDQSELHKGLTSYDTEDPAMILMMREAVQLNLDALRSLAVALENKAGEHQWTLMIARTHGQFAEPDTFGHLLFVFAVAVRRGICRLETAYTTDLAEGKMSGAVGNYAGMSTELELVALRELDLKPALAETQILQRDRLAAVLAAIAVTAGSIEQMARTFWEMMRSDVGELAEPRGKNQRGSSAMAHKANPILTEQLMGLSRKIRGDAHAAMENIATPEGRDISQSSVERHILPDTTSLLHYMTTKAAGLVNDLVVFPDRMRENLDEKSLGVWASQRVRTSLMEAGVPYDAAYTYMQRLSFEAVKARMPLSDLLRLEEISDNEPRSALHILGRDALVKCFDAEAYIRPGIEAIFKRKWSLSSK